MNFAVEDRYQVEDKLYKKQGDSSVGSLTELVKQVRMQKVAVKKAMSQSIRGLAGAVESEVYNAVLAAPGSGKQAEEAVEKIISKYSDRIQQELERELQQAQEIIQIRAKETEKDLAQLAQQSQVAISGQAGKLGTMSIGAGRVDLEAAATEQGSSVGQSVSIGELVSKGTFANEVGKQVSQFVGKQVVKTLVSSGFKQAATYVAKFVPYIGPIVIVGTILYSLFGGKSDSDYEEKQRQAEAYNEQSRRQLEHKKRSIPQSL